MKVTIAGHTDDVIITIKNPFKFKQSSNLTPFEYNKYLDKVSALDSLHLYNYLHMPSDDTVIENPLSASAFLETNHPFNKYTICQLDALSIGNTIQIQGIK